LKNKKQCGTLVQYSKQGQEKRNGKNRN